MTAAPYSVRENSGLFVTSVELSWNTQASVLDGTSVIWEQRTIAFTYARVSCYCLRCGQRHDHVSFICVLVLDKL